MSEGNFYQLIFEKKGPSIFIPQIYLSYLFFRVCRACGVEFVYTQGFHAKPKARFLYPLSVGVGGEEEHFYFWAYFVPEGFLNCANQRLPVGVKFKQINIFPFPKVSESDVESAEFTLTLKEDPSVAILEGTSSFVISRKDSLTFEFTYFYNKGLKFREVIEKLTGRAEFSNVREVMRKKINFSNRLLKILNIKEAEGSG